MFAKMIEMKEQYFTLRVENGKQKLYVNNIDIRKNKMFP